jgi:hypothetical protein
MKRRRIAPGAQGDAPPATAQDGSASSVDERRGAAELEVQAATARLNRGCAAELQDVVNDTIPS